MSRMVIESCVREMGTDPIFRMAGKAKERSIELGKEAIINSTIGALMNDDGVLVTFDSVYNLLKELPNDQIANYAGISGIPEFLNKVIDACFHDCKPAGHLRAVATPGGTGAVRHAVTNYTELGDKILISDWHWAPYKTIAAENRRSCTFFELFDKTGNFNINAYQESFSDVLSSQNRILSILNTPAHNPTGYSISLAEWEKLKEFYIEKANSNKDKCIIILCDIAYIDFAGEGDSERKFMQTLSNLPENVLILYAFSASKGYTMYGLRNGALICVAPTEDIANEFEAACSFSNRGTWSNGTRGAMQVLADIYSDNTKLENYKKEAAKYKEILQRRARVFLENAEKIGLELIPYRDGFFISIPCKNPVAIGEYLMEKNLFIVALEKGLRFAPCSVSEEKCAKSPQIILDAIKLIDKI